MTILSLAELSLGIKVLLENTFESIKVKGEVIQCKRYPSGHLYFSLKENDYMLDCVCWKSVKTEFEPKDGIEVICTGKLTSYPGRSKYQLNVTKIEQSGLGEIMRAIEERKQRLAKEGLFDQSKKLPIPKYIRQIGIITSPKGAVIHDMLHRLRDRYPIKVVLYPIPVQGPEVPESAIKAINYFHANPVDVIILARGGGSFEDLIGFQDESLTRTVATSKIPIVTAIGHETDTTLVDYASSLRAPTPTASIELITPDRKQILSSLDDMLAHLTGSLTRILSAQAPIIRSLKLRKSSILDFMQRYDYAGARLKNAIQRHIPLDQIGRRLNKIDFKAHNKQCADFGMRQANHMSKVLELMDGRLSQTEQLLKAVSYKNTLKRGFCRAFSGKSQLLKRKDTVSHKEFCIEFFDGKVNVAVCESD